MMGRFLLKLSSVVGLMMGLSGPLALAQAPVPQLVKNIWPANGGRGLEKFDKVGIVGNRIFFTANDGVTGEEPWVSDGTEAGTFLLRDIRPGVQGSIPSGVNVANFSGFAVLNNKVFFTANDGVSGAELWVSDGTPAGTQLLVDIEVGGGSSSPANFFVWNDKILFTANTTAFGRELWITNGTAAGTFMVKDIFTQFVNGGNTGSSNPNHFAVLNGRVYFAATTHDTGRELWVTDGTSAGTYLFKNLRVETAWWINRFDSNPTELTVMNGRIYFQAFGPASGNDCELWATDGTPDGTVMVKDINPNPDGNSWPKGFTVFNNKLYFQADDGATGQELWVSDGTENGTVLVKDLVPGAPGSGPVNFFVFNNRLCFVALNQVNGYFHYWLSDGTAQGTQLYSQLYPNQLLAGSNTLRPLVVGNKAFLAASPYNAPLSRVYDFWLMMVDDTWTTTLLYPPSFNQLAHIPSYNGFHLVGSSIFYAGQYLSSVSIEPYRIDISSLLETSAQWVGSTSNDWHTASNWSNNMVPDAQTVVLIPAGTAPCVVTAANAVAKRVTVATGAELRLQNGRLLLVSQ